MELEVEPDGHSRCRRDSASAFPGVHFLRAEPSSEDRDVARLRIGCGFSGDSDRAVPARHSRDAGGVAGEEGQLSPRGCADPGHCRGGALGASRRTRTGTGIRSRCSSRGGQDAPGNCGGRAADCAGRLARDACDSWLRFCARGFRELREGGSWIGEWGPGSGRAGRRSTWNVSVTCTLREMSGAVSGSVRAGSEPGSNLD